MTRNSNTPRLSYDCFWIRNVLRGIVIGIGVLSVTLSAWAQPAKPPAAKPEEGEKKEEKKPPKPERVWLETKDGWKISCMYYGPKEDIRDGKETVPIILIHGWGGQGSEYSYLAMGLQTYGHAAIVPDLRGHGRSTSRELPNGDIQVIKHDDKREFTAREQENMVLDIEACKKFLMEKNNVGEVNIEMLCVVGAEFGSIVAMNWAAMDWSWPRTPYIKQGQDVKALVLLSARQSMQRLNATNALAHPAIKSQLSILFAVGEQDRKAYGEAKRIYGRLEKVRPDPPKDRDERLRKQTLFFVTADTNLQGTALLNKNLPINRNIVGIIDLRLLRKREDFIWSERKNPIASN